MCAAASLLLEAGAPLPSSNFKEASCLHICAAQSAVDTAAVCNFESYSILLLVSLTPSQVLLQHGHPPNVRDQEGRCPLHLSSSETMDRLLMEHGARSGIRDEHGRSARESSTAGGAEDDEEQRMQTRLGDMEPPVLRRYKNHLVSTHSSSSYATGRRSSASSGRQTPCTRCAWAAAVVSSSSSASTIGKAAPPKFANALIIIITAVVATVVPLCARSVRPRAVATLSTAAHIWNACATAASICYTTNSPALQRRVAGNRNPRRRESWDALQETKVNRNSSFALRTMCSRIRFKRLTRVSR